MCLPCMFYNCQKGKSPCSCRILDYCFGNCEFRECKLTYTIVVKLLSCDLIVMDSNFKNNLL